MWRTLMDNIIYNEFEKWIDVILGGNISNDVIAFNFNLYEAEDSYHIQLIGAPTFSQEDQDWACYEVFTTGENIFIINRKIAGQDWEQGLKFSKNMIIKYLEEGKYNYKLKEKQAVGIGFVDGDLEILFRKESG
jgi:hypothetical protein